VVVINLPPTNGDQYLGVVWRSLPDSQLVRLDFLHRRAIAALKNEL
jgi:hypothetical protein